MALRPPHRPHPEPNTVTRCSASPFRLSASRRQYAPKSPETLAWLGTTIPQPLLAALDVEVQQNWRHGLGRLAIQHSLKEAGYFVRKRFEGVAMADAMEVRQVPNSTPIGYDQRIIKEIKAVFAKDFFLSM